jgi:hypothetical protein
VSGAKDRNLPLTKRKRDRRSRSENEKTMKRVGKIFEKAVELENLRLAFWKASRSKRHRPDQRAFAKNLEKEIQHLRDGLNFFR